ncbi:MAG: translation elongation factor Ts [bacterium]|nr:translation elongation factor Ts [bacterium]
MISAQEIKDLRERTGAGISDVKRALEESGGDHAKAFAWLEHKLGSAAIKKASRATGAGLVDSYIHSNGRVGAMVEVFCETDFVARNPTFREFAHSIALHIAAMNPLYLTPDAVPDTIRRVEKDRFAEETAKLNKPDAIVAEIITGKLASHFGALSLMTQPFVKDQERTVGEFVNEAIGRFGENIKIGSFIRFEV